MDTQLFVMDATRGLEALFRHLLTDGYQLLGPSLQQGAILLDQITSISELPKGWTDHQSPGEYRLQQTEDAAYFGHHPGPHAPKSYLHVPHQELWHVTRTESGLHIDAVPPDAPRYAFIGLRACEIAALKIQDATRLLGGFPDEHYAARRKDNLMIAVQCTEAGGTCFCTSFNTGPELSSGFDLALTELTTDGPHRFLIQSGSLEGESLLQFLPTTIASTADITLAQDLVRRTADKMPVRLDATTTPALLAQHQDHPIWTDIAERCLSCGNCTMVCPTCFCTRETEHSDLTNITASHAREWDSCFNLDFSYLHGGAVRSSVSARYRQWITHKLSSWVDQFGGSGCVGCGRCLTWCPVGIDITETIQTLQDQQEG